jgi:hypothetical protein
MSRLELLDPTRPDDPAFDPAGPQAQRVLAAAMRPVPEPRRAPKRLALVLAAAAAVAVAVVLATGTTAPTDARAALLQAAERTSAIDSGRVVWTLKADLTDPLYKADIRNEIRFSGNDLEMVGTGQETLPNGQILDRRTTFRLVDGIGYERDGDGRFQELGPVSHEGQLQITGQIDNEALVALVRSTDDLTVDGSTYRGTVTAGEFEDAAPTAPGRAKGPAWNRPIKLELTIDGEGLIRRIVATGEHEVRTTEYLDLGSRQVIEKP